MRNFQLVCSSPSYQVVSDHDQAVWSIRSLKYILLWLLLWQDNMVPGSPIQIIEHIGSPAPFNGFEVWLFLCLAVLAIERVMVGYYEMKRSYFWGPLLLMTFSLVLSYTRGAYMLQHFKPVVEAHEAIMLPVAYFIVLNLFREPGEWRVLPTILILACAAKALDGSLIYFFSSSPIKNWGVLQEWRDGFLLAVGIVSVVLMLHYKGTALKWLRWTMIASLPLLLFALIVSYRRTFLLASLAGLLAMFLTLPRDRRMKHFWLLVTMVLGMFVFILLTDPIGFLTRLVGGVMNPKDEGSAYIRLMELPNILLNIYHNPILGVPVGTFWKQYYRMPLIAVYTLYGCHDTYLYWPLRTGIPGTFAFWWFLMRNWKTLLIQRRVAVYNEETQYFSQLGIQVLVIYHVACFLGLLYADGFIIMAVLMAWLQLMLEAELGVKTLRDVKLFPTLKAGKLVFWDKRPSPQTSSAVVQGGAQS
ncbi:MAG: O-antigen ligase family protein [Bacteroidetes bacterium]|nr:O-antigen ligase family protein [Bacteroidota bacterium]